MEGQIPDRTLGSLLGSSKSNPAPVGAIIKTTIERGEAYSAPEIYNVEITLLEIMRRDEAWELIKGQNPLNETPKAAFEFVLAYIRFGYFRRSRGTGGEVYRLTKGQFAAVSPDGKTEYEIPAALSQPQPQLIGSILSPGESRDGWILLQVPEDDEKPLMIFKRQNTEGVHGVWGPIWFQLY